MSADEGAEELEEVQADLRKKDEEVKLSKLQYWIILMKSSRIS